jgi:hypothetical protein
MGREILKRAALPQHEADIVLVHLTHNAITPWVTWQMNLPEEDTYWGHYYKTLEEATNDFNARCRRKQAVEYTDHRPQRG